MASEGEVEDPENKKGSTITNQGRNKVVLQGLGAAGGRLSSVMDGGCRQMRWMIVRFSGHRMAAGASPSTKAVAARAFAMWL